MVDDVIRAKVSPKDCYCGNKEVAIFPQRKDCKEGEHIDLLNIEAVAPRRGLVVPEPEVVLAFEHWTCRVRPREKMVLHIIVKSPYLVSIRAVMNINRQVA
jgi:flavorubredoxin